MLDFLGLDGGKGRFLGGRGAALLAAASVLALVLAACAETPNGDGGDGGSEGDGGGEAAAQEDAAPAEGGLVTVDLGITVTSVMSPIPIAVAEDQGFFEDEGVQIGEMVEAEGGATTLRQVLAGGLDMGDVATAAVIEGYLAGAPVTVVGSSHQRPYDLLWATRPGEDISSVEDMVGRVWGYTNPSSVTHDLSYVVPEAAGADVDAFERVATGGMGGGIAMLEAGEVDLALVAPLVMAQDPDAYQVAFEALDYIDAYQKSVYIAHGPFMEENPEAVRGVLAAINRAMEFVRENPEEAAEIYDAVSEDYDYETLLDEIELANERGALEGGVGFNRAGLENVGVGLRLRAGVEAVPWSDIFDPGYLPDGVETELPEDPPPEEDD